MFVYQHSSLRATRPAAYTSCLQHRAAFARQAVHLEFRPRDARALDQGNFVDRQPDERPRLSPATWRRETNGTKRVELADLIGREGA